MRNRRWAVSFLLISLPLGLAVATQNEPPSGEAPSAPKTVPATTAPAKAAAAKDAAAEAVPAKSAPAAKYRSVWINDVPHIRQRPDFCGEACAAMFLRRIGRAVDQDWVFDQSGLSPAAGRGCYTKELVAALKNIGFRPGAVWYRAPAEEEAKYLQANFQALHADLLKGIPSIVCTHYDDREGASEHFRLILGYDAASDEVLYHEPAETRGAYRRMKRAMLLKLWPLRYSEKESTLIRMRLEPGPLKQGAVAADYTAADYAQHVLALKQKLPAGFHVVIQPPFVVIGDDSPTRVQASATRTVKWAVDRLKKAYFPKDPEEILDIWLFRNPESYRKHTKAIFNDEPTTPYGYFSHTHKALIMDISTGGGTLVHEIVHPFVAANFPACPSWLNEGLGSLYEQSGEDRLGRIIGRTNWRLAGLQKAIAEERVPSFKTLCSTTTMEFYTQDKGTNYGQARYLCYYLQQHGLLRKYYHAFYAAQREDPTGYNTLEKVLGRDDMEEFQQEWETYVMKLRFP